MTSTSNIKTRLDKLQMGRIPQFEKNFFNLKYNEDEDGEPIILHMKTVISYTFNKLKELDLDSFNLLRGKLKLKLVKHRNKNSILKTVEKYLGKMCSKWGNSLEKLDYKRTTSFDGKFYRKYKRSLFYNLLQMIIDNDFDFDKYPIYEHNNERDNEEHQKEYQRNMAYGMY